MSVFENLMPSMRDSIRTSMYNDFDFFSNIEESRKAHIYNSKLKPFPILKCYDLSNFNPVHSDMNNTLFTDQC